MGFFTQKRSQWHSIIAPDFLACAGRFKRLINAIKGITTCFCWEKASRRNVVNPPPQKKKLPVKMGKISMYDRRLGDFRWLCSKMPENRLISLDYMVNILTNIMQWILHKSLQPHKHEKNPGDFQVKKFQAVKKKQPPLKKNSKNHKLCMATSHICSQNEAAEGHLP